MLEKLVVPYHNQNHCLLAVGFVDTFSIVIIGPFNPAHVVKNSYVRGVAVSTFNLLCKTYMDHLKADYEIWDVSSSDINKYFFDIYKLPTQPSRNGCDCGSYICIYSHCFIVVSSLVQDKPSSARMRRFKPIPLSDSVMADARMKIILTVIQAGAYDLT